MSGKHEYSIEKITKQQASTILLQWHYLKDISKGFKSGINYGLFKKAKLVGVCIYTGFPVPELASGMFGLDRNDQSGLYELSRLCLEPSVQNKEHNLASWFVSRTLKLLKREFSLRCVLSYADNDYHKGIVYRACNFKYYGLTAKKKDFWIKQGDGTFKKHSRGKVVGLDGEWRDRSRKHRYAIVIDKTLKIKWREVIKKPPS